jgi:predicted PurR-regulated permease PerM
MDNHATIDLEMGMNESHKELISMGLTVLIVAVSLFIIHRFIPSLIWASIIVVATYPLYRLWEKLLGNNKNIAAFLFTLMMVLLFVVPLSWLVRVLFNELQIFLNYLQTINRDGGHAPFFLQDIPFVGKEMIAYWDANIGQPGHLKNFLSNIHISLTPTSYYLQQIGSNLAHRGFQVGFTVLCLFFLYRDGGTLLNQINFIGAECLGKRWYRYADGLPSALRATVNGTIVVGIGVGILMGICYGLVHAPGPTLCGFITAFAAMIPFVVPLVFVIVALILFSTGSIIGAVIVLIWGTIVMFVADHFIKPVLIGGAIQLPFLAVLFGILGGVETLGLLGLFVGPVIMVLFITLWNESQDKREVDE